MQNVTPEEMVSRLKTSNVMSVAVDTNIYHSFDPHNHQGILLETKLGFRYFTKWKPKPGTDYENTTSSWDLVIQILEKERGLVRYKDFRLTNTQLDYNSRNDFVTPLFPNHHFLSYALRVVKVVPARQLVLWSESKQFS